MRSGHDRDLGIYRKFHVTRHDPYQKHANCFYFVLDTDHDEYSVPALEAYAVACKEKFPALATDLQALIKVLRIKHLPPIAEVKASGSHD